MKFKTEKLGQYLYIKGRIGWKGLKKNEYLNEGEYRIINGESLSSNGIDWNKAGYITEERYEESPEIKLQENDILISKDGTIGKIGFVKKLSKPSTVASGIFVIRNNNKEQIDTRFIYHYLRSPYFRNFIKARTEGSVIPHLYQKDFVELDFPLCSLLEQKKISSILDAIDEKIQVNKDINDNLLQQAQAIFKHWFTDNPNLDDMKQVPLAELCLVVTKGTTPTTLGKPFVTEGINFIKVESILDNHTFDQNKFAFIDSETNNLLKRSIIHSGDIIFTIAGTLGRFALIDDSVLPANTNQAVAIIRANQNKVTPDYLYSFFLGNWHNDYYRKRIQQAVQANLNLGTIKSLPIPILPDKAMSEYLGILSPIITMTKANELEITRLRAIRDTLLPKLMSGQVDVSAIEL